jgi:transposase
VKHTQNWQAYNKAQTSEKSIFLGLLSELTRQIDEPAQMNGRPAINLGDMVFACVFKVYSQMSSRRFSTDLKDAQVKGYINQVPHFSSLNCYMEKASLTQYLEALIEETAKPLTALETDFAIDSTGLSISNTVAWSHAKYKDAKFLQSKNWVKVHCCIGTHTNIVTSVVITDKTSHDANHFISLLDNTSRNFEVREISADAAYSNNRNLNFTMKNIGTFIPFKDKTSFNNRHSTAVWHRLYHFFQLNRAEFLQSYGKRNNAESTFHMLKSKFGSTLKSRNWEAQKNEALCKVVCHNIACLVHAMTEFGVKPSLGLDLLLDAKLLNRDENVLKV